MHPPYVRPRYFQHWLVPSVQVSPQSTTFFNLQSGVDVIFLSHQRKDTASATQSSRNG